MRYLIVNADDFGASPGINLGILEAHRTGIVTSSSLMVDTPWSAEAAAMGRATTELSVGLHVALDVAIRNGRVQDPEVSSCRAREELRRQLARFEELMGRAPTHIDSHHNVHCDPSLLADFLECSRSTGLPLRGYSNVRYFSKFYGRWSGESHPEQIGFESLVRMLQDEIGDGVAELSCHPGHIDPRVPSDYALEREVELQTLCDPRLVPVLESLGIALVGFRDLGRLVATDPGNEAS